MNNIELIAFDADDTLWINMSLYFDAINRIKEILGSYVGLDKFQENFYKIESENIPALGYGTKGFIVTMVEVAIKSSSQMIQANEIQDIISIGKNLMNSPIELLDGVEKVVSKLASKSGLMLLTKGDHFEQQGKIDRSGFSKYFPYVEIVIEKDENSYSKILENQNVAPENFLMIGNSLKSDIMPVVNIGGNAVYIPHKDTWHREEIGEDSIEKRYYQLEDIRELPDFLIKKFDIK
ncbi:MAG: HAD family hydrolase [Deltaproteobacteria bacterium]|nr:HAD family hydrolase [Deltaproteobacteria bacterium]